MSPKLDAKGLPVGYPFKPEWEIAPREVKTALGTGKITLLDCRRQDEWDTCRIIGAVHIPMDQVERRADELEGDDGERSEPIVVYCHHGARSLRVTAALRAMGFADVRSMAGGIDLWSMDVDPGVPRY